MKKKALITSTVLLLVALMCLATASYAWFTAGNTNGIAEFQLTISAGDSALEVATADQSSSYANGGWKTSLTKNDFTGGIGVLPNSDTLKAVSTDGTYASGFSFYGVGDYDSAANKWVSVDASDNEYALLTFYVKSTKNGTAALNVDAGTDAKFKSAVKVGYSVTPVTGSVGTPVNFATYDLDSANESYQPVIATGAEITRDAQANFVPVTAGDAKFATARTTTNTWTNQSITFDSATADAPQTYLVTVALWLEGQDKQCSGTYDITNYALTLNLTWAE